MNEMEKLREEILSLVERQNKARVEFNLELASTTLAFLNVIDRAREIERQAGIGEVK